jgi:hypothetical protein
MLAQQILKGIDDDYPLTPLVCGPSPLGDLIAGYSKEPEAVTTPVTPQMTGAQFKEALDKINPESLVTLLAKYSAATKSLMTPTVYAEDPEKRDSRRLRHWMMKGAFVVSSTIALIVVGASMAIAYRTGVVDNALVQTLMTTASDILKLLLSTPSTLP